MLDKQFLDSVLRLNHSSAAMTDGEVAAVLEKAGWKPEDIESALVMLHTTEEDSAEDASRTLGASFRPDMDFSSKDLSKLLGVDVTLDPERVGVQERNFASGARDFGIRFMIGTSVVLLSLGLAMGAAVGAAHYFGFQLPF